MAPSWDLGVSELAASKLALGSRDEKFDSIDCGARISLLFAAKDMFCGFLSPGRMVLPGSSDSG